MLLYLSCGVGPAYALGEGAGVAGEESQPTAAAPAEDARHRAQSEPAPVSSGADEGENSALDGADLVTEEGQQSDKGLVAILFSDNTLLIRPYEDGDEGLFAEGPRVEGHAAGEGDADEGSDADGAHVALAALAAAPSANAASAANAVAGAGGADSDGLPCDDGIGPSSRAPVIGGIVDDASRAGVIKAFLLGTGEVELGQDAPWYTSRGAIRFVSFGEGTRPQSMARWFVDLDQLVSIDFTNLDTSQVADMNLLFSSCNKLTQLDFSRFDTRGVADMSYMFKDCSGLTGLDLSSFDTSAVTSMAGMFAGCKGLRSIDLSSFDTLKVADMSAMFEGCSGVALLDLSSFRTESLVKAEKMFAGCASLAALDAPGFTAEQLYAAAVPTDNAGGFWRLNGPEGYDAGITLREPTDTEKVEAGVSGVSGNSGARGENGAAGPGDEAGSLPSADADKEKAGQPQPGGSAEGGSSEGQEDVAAGAVASVDDVPAEPAQSPNPQGALLVDAVNDVATSFAAPVTETVVDAALGATVMDAIGGLFDEAHMKSAADKTLSMVIAAFGMIVAAALLLMVCLKIR